MIQCGCRRGAAEAKNVFQSALVAGEKTLVPSGQLFLSFDLRASMQLVHFTTGPGEKYPFRARRLHLHDFGLPLAAVVDISVTPLHSVEILPFASMGSGANSALLYAPVAG